MSYDDDYSRQQQRREDERREQLREEQRREQQRQEERRAEQRREDERHAEHARQDAEYDRKKAEEERQALMKNVRDGDMEIAFARLGMAFPKNPNAEPGQLSRASEQPQSTSDPKAQAETLRQEIARILQGISNDPALSNEDKQFFTAINEASYLDKLKPCLLAQLEQLARQVDHMQDLQLPYDPLGLQSQVQHQKLQEIENSRQTINQELQWLTERRELLMQQANKIVYGNPKGAS